MRGTILVFVEYLRIVRRHIILIMGATLVGAVVSGIILLTAQPSYTSKTQLFVAIQNSGSVTELQQGNTFSQARVKSYVETARTPAVLQPVIDTLGLSTSPADLAKHISASADLNTVIITISASDKSPIVAAALAQAVGSSLIDVVQELESPSDTQASPVRLSVITPAVAPVVPSSPNVLMGLAVGTLVGLTAGIIAALLRTHLDNRIRGTESFTRVCDVPVLGGISYDADAAKKPLLTQAKHQSPRAEAFRQIRTNLQFANVNSTSNILLVTSTLPGEGKTTTATNMAIAMAQAGQRVVLVDADLRRPMVASYLGLEGKVGLTTALMQTAGLSDLLQPWGQDELYVLTSGQIPPNPSELLGSAAMDRLLAQLEREFDVVIVDAPPLLPVTDSSVLAQKVGGVVLVVGSGKIRVQDLQKSLASLRLVDANIVGAAVNLLPTKGPDAYEYSYYTYEAKDPAEHPVPSAGPGPFSSSSSRGERRRKDPSSSL